MPSTTGSKLHDLEMRKLEELRLRAKTLIKDMERLVDNIDKNKDEAAINSLGEVQTQGAVIDRLCAEISVLRTAYSISECAYKGGRWI